MGLHIHVCTSFILIFFSAISFCFCSGQIQYPLGDVRNCPTSQLRDPNATLLRMNVLPGLGFDNLKNLDIGRVYNISYSSCQISNDGLYILPDGFYVEPVLNSEVDYSAEVISHFDQHKSATAASINREEKFSSVFSSVSGKFSADYQATKFKMVNSNSHSVKVGLRHHVYSVHVNPDANLNPPFKSRILDIAANIQNNNTELAHFLTDQLIRDYGTHVVTSIEAGAALYQTTFIDKKSSMETDSSKLAIAISASASVGFFVTFSISSNFKFATSHVNSEAFSDSTTHSHTSTHGGPPFKLSNFSYADWEKGILDNLVAIDRRGVPIYSAISSSNVPELPDVLLLKTIDYIYKSFNKYYQINTHYGCTDPESENFNFQANVEDKSCKTDLQNHTFGGIYQTCHSPSVANCESSTDCDICDTLSARQTNPLTNDYSCPNGYRSILLHTGTLTKPVTIDDCHRKCILFFCHTVCQKRDVINYGFYKAYWCAYSPNEATSPDSGYMFGGVYTSKQQNPITGSRSCPVSFYPLHFGEDIEVCVSNDIEEGALHSLPFGGFMSCTQGNPLAAIPSHFLEGIYPHRCPPLYSKFLLTEDQGCIVYYCTEVLAFNQQFPLPPQVPPYRVKASLSVNVSNTLVLTGPYGTVWVKDTNGEWYQYTEGSYGTGNDYIQAVYAQSTGADDGGFNDGVAIGAVIGTFIGIIMLVAITVIILVIIIRKFIKYRKRKQNTYFNIEGEEPELQALIS